METKLEWLAQVKEDILEPDRPIIDPHHHFGPDYVINDLWLDTNSGHNIKKTVYIECGAKFRTEGDVDFRPLGETEYVLTQIDKSNQGAPDTACVAGIVGHVNLNIGAKAGDVLDAHLELAPSLFKGIRHSCAWDAYDNLRGSHANPTQTTLMEEGFRAGIRELAIRGLSFDAWCFFHTIPMVTDLARANPDLTIILNHFGGPLGAGPYRGKREENFPIWKDSIAELAKCQNVVAKLGGMAMPITGFDWHKRETPATSDELVEAEKKYYHHTIDMFGPERCMFEANFPVDKVSISYHVLWNAFKKLAANYSEAEKQNLFHDTAKRVYSL